MRILGMMLVLAAAGMVSACDDKVANATPETVASDTIVYEMDVPEAESVELPDLTPQECEFDALVGTVYADGVLGDIGDRPVRVLYPDSMATMDYSPNRINVHVEKDTDVITAVRCG